MTTPQTHELAGTAKVSLGLARLLFGFASKPEIVGDSPAGERLRVGGITLATQPATVPPCPTPGGAAPPQGEGA